MIELCLTTFDKKMIKESREKYPINCYAMNPSIAVNALKNNQKTFLEEALEIREIIGQEDPFFIQVIGTTAEEMIEDGRRIKETIPGNTYVKIPASKEGYRAISVLTNEGIKCSCTAVFTVNQAILAATAGAEYVAIYVSRLNNNGEDGFQVIKEIKEIFKEHDLNCKVCAASIKNTQQVKQSISYGAENVTVDYDLLEKMAEHSLTDSTLKKFKEDWENLFGKNIRISNMEV